MVQYVITPWRDRQELLGVRDKFYPGSGKPTNEAERRHAAAQVAVWVQRGNCPHLVESTAIMTSAILNDVPGNSSYCVRAAYSAAFSRFVTGLLDSHQDKRRKLSMFYIAKTIGLPATYVELRHQATHEELPSLSKLRIATEKALRWIWDYYWQTLKADISDDEECKKYILRLLGEVDGRSRESMERHLRRWGQDEVINALMEIQEDTEDAEVLLRSIQLQESILEGSGKTSYSRNGSENGSHVNNIDEISAELKILEGDMLDEDEVGHSRVGSSNNEADDTGNGWTMWVGPWVPKPIGVV